MFIVSSPPLPMPLKAVLLTLLLFTLSGCSHTTLEDQFNGIEVCGLKNIYLDQVTNTPTGAYFTERGLKPCRIDEVAFYCLSDTFYGLPVNEVAIPYLGPFSVHAIYFRASPATVKSVLQAKRVGIVLNNSDGRSPKLIENPKQKGQSVLYCDKYSE
ncbi:hypothetical protein [Pseudomonas viridiflava]|uniref:Hypothetical secreted protein n=1 Tax=Pseudomonas viridiflava TaxID=33069 RepID=A0A1Y6JSF0_PSEVI|nr:hypothetical protein [Pseudomonas viridiflava]MEE5129846.1 hypothetical protein [Pseudomonas alliivorans]VVO22069.1 hypothetical protein PS689_04316 [Pseudomonas fluorescens]UZA71551.1 hypothetical protein EZZ81_26245 [Pseudomonas viridiflava]WKW33133.1 hypothetical protein KIH13_04340 [Pseudomonas viridiflava]SMS12845.1 hypothetical secreted protein [Pseudomonas viridiflava]